ncbi:MAG: hypothetical protein JRE23_08575 [Deltaproteobacteria bacterium]|nr:hypothetical protein [Deltaproteobacteria bacterium]
MTTKTKIAFGCYLLAAAMAIATGLIYLFSPQFMPYHADAIGVNWEDLEPRFQMLFLALLKGGGAGALGSGIALGIMLFVPFRRGHAWSRWAIPVVGLTGYLPVLYVALTIELNTPASPPWPLIAVSITLLIAGFLLSSSLGKTTGAK